MSPGNARSQATGMPARRWPEESPGMVNPARPSTYAVRPEQSNPISVPQLLNCPPPRAHPLFGPAPEPPPPHTYGRPSAANPARNPEATAGVGAMIDRPASPLATNAFAGTGTDTGAANPVTAAATLIPVFPPPVDPKYRLNRKKKFRLPYAEQASPTPGYAANEAGLG